jgi:mono/diheme cytochrome c family protein
MMLMNKPSEKMSGYLRTVLLGLFLCSVGLSVGCRYDMQDQPRYKPYKESKFYADGRAMREAPDGTVARGKLNEDKALFTGRIAGSDPSIQGETTIDSNGNTIVSSFPGMVEELPVPLTKELLERGEQRYRVFCIVCHGPVGKGDGMVVRRGYPKPSTYHDDRLRNAPVGHFFDVISNGWGKMNGYSSQIPVADRWAIVAYIRALQASQDVTPKTADPAKTENNEGATEKQDTQTQMPVNSDGGEK